MLLKRPEDPFADQLEWLNHRYDPGYFLGGTLRPELRLSLGTRAKRAAALLAFGSGIGVVGLMAIVSLAFGGFMPEPYSWGLGVLSLLVGKKMWIAASAEGPLDIAEEKQRFYRLAEMAGLATVVVAFAVVATVVIAAVAAMIKGRMAIAASLALLLAIAALRRRGEL